jgi:hypothetical protein
VAVVDIRDPARPTLLAEAGLPARRIALLEPLGRLVVMDGGRSLQLLDVSAPERGLAATSFEPGGTVRDLVAEGRRAWLLTGAGLEVWDFGEPGGPVRLAELPELKGFTRLDLAAGRLYASTAGGRLEVREAASLALLARSTALPAAHDPWGPVRTAEVTAVQPLGAGLAIGTDVAGLWLLSAQAAQDLFLPLTLRQETMR